MKQPSCPVHGFGRHLVNAGAPFIVRCVADGSCGVILERCHHCRGQVSFVSEADGLTTSYCSHCTTTPHPGWQTRKTHLGSGYPVS